MSGGERWLVVTAMPEELDGVVEGLDAQREDLPSLEAAWRAERDGDELLLAATGDGAVAAERGLRAALEAGFSDGGRCDRLFILGIAGGLSPDLGPAEVVEAGRVVDLDRGETHYPGGAGSEAVGTVVASDRILVKPAEKADVWRRAGEPGRAVVDLETFTWARMAAERDLPWRAFRAVSDTAEERLPIDFNRFRDDEGSIDRDRVASWIVTHPLSWSGLRRLQGRVKSSAEALAERWFEEVDG